MTLRHQHAARERYLASVLAKLSASEIERRSAKASKQIFGSARLKSNQPKMP